MKKRFIVIYGEQDGDEEADTHEEARGLIKRFLGLHPEERFALLVMIDENLKASVTQYTIQQTIEERTTP